MRTVVYDRETMEPLTVIHLSWNELRLARRRGGRLRLAAYQPMRVPSGEVDDDLPVPFPMPFNVVDLLVERLYRDGKRCGVLVTTTTPEAALLLDAVFCAGQYTELARRNVRIDA